MTIPKEEYAHVSCGCEHGGLLGAYDEKMTQFDFMCIS